MRYLYILLFCFCQNLAFAQDLLISSYSGPMTYAKYAEFEHIFTIQNGGIVSITQTPSHGFYLSTDNQLDPNDYYIGSGQQESSELMPGDYTLVTVTYSSLEIDPGSYFLIYFIDPTNIITETDEDNNTLIVAGITITSPDIDFEFSNFDTNKSSYSSYEVIDPAYLVVNNGTTNVGSGLYTSFYVSSDNTLSEDDTYLNYDYGSLSGADDTEDWIHFRLITPELTPGDYYLFARTNYYDPSATSKFEETDASNNLSSKMISIVAAPSLDLSIISSHVIVTNSELGFIDGNVDIMNTGDITVGGYELEIQFRDSDGMPTGFTSLNADENLEPGINNINFSTYSTLPPGTYTYSLRINNSQALAETDFTNNEYNSLETIVISPPPFEQVTLNSITVPSSYDNTDEEITIQLDLTNTGTDPNYIQYFGIEITDGAGNVVYYNETSTIIDFEPETTATKLIPLALEQPLETGTYVITILDRYPYNTIFEQTQTDLIIVPVQYAFTGTIKGEDGTSISKGKLFLYQKDNIGTITFIQKITPYEGPSFLFQIDEHSHTLYFVPDPVLYPNFVPTIYGKTVTLSDDNFFTATADIDTVFRILKVNPLATGEGFIHGIIVTNENSGGRNNADGTPLAGIPVLLLTASGEVVGLTYTNEAGYYEFINLPRGTYQVLISRELDKTIMASPYAVDIIVNDANVNFTFSDTGIETTTNEIVGTEDELTSIIYYPNPTHNKVKLFAPEGSNITVINAVGNLPVNVPYKNEELDFTQVPAGVYLVKITNGKSNRVVKLIRN